ncbi:MAG: iron chelate uptake ABC transporter family permease subunit [Desulfotomaculaceae bacterium]
MPYPAKQLWHLLIAVGMSGLFVIMIFCFTLGPANITFGEALVLLLAKIPFLGQLFDLSRYPETHQVILYQVRLPRVILAALVGAALAAVGTTFQGIFRNPMADPYIIGVSSGAALGAAIAIVTGLSVMLGMWALPLAAFLGAVLSTWLVYNLARVGGRVPVYTLLLAGVALSAFMSALMSFVMIVNASELQQIIFWMLGSFSGRDWSHVLVAAPVIILGIISLWVFSRDLNAMLFGEETAQHLGIETEKLKKILLVLSAITVAAAVSVSGTIGFVGLIIPHMVRLFTGPDHRILLPVAALTGASFMVITDTFARVALAPTEIPVGIITAFFGGPFFIYLLKRKKSNLF